MIMDDKQAAVCEKVGAVCFPALAEQKVGISESALAGERPLHGLRHPPVGDTCGWYIWAGDEPGTEEDFFKPLHVAHLNKLVPDVQSYLGLPPGWRFLIADNYEDIWFDPQLLTID
jgi:hypothetical protein